MGSFSCSILIRLCSDVVGLSSSCCKVWNIWYWVMVFMLVVGSCSVVFV